MLKFGCMLKTSLLLSGFVRIHSYFLVFAGLGDGCWPWFRNASSSSSRWSCWKGSFLTQILPFSWFGCTVEECCTDLNSHPQVFFFFFLVILKAGAFLKLADLFLTLGILVSCSFITTFPTKKRVPWKSIAFLF